MPTPTHAPNGAPYTPSGSAIGLPYQPTPRPRS